MDELLENVVAEVVEDLCKNVVRKEKRRLYMQKYNEKRKEKKRLYMQKYMKKYYEKNRDKILLANKKYDADNKEKRNATIRKRLRKRRREDPEFKLRHNLRNRINQALKNNTKSARSLELLGCSGSEYRKYLEDQFHDSASGDTMTWDNHGKCHGHWQIDHRVPLCSFDLSQPAEQKKAFHYTNTQPLWYDAHCAKGTVVPDTHEWRDGAWHLK